MENYIAKLEEEKAALEKEVRLRELAWLDQLIKCSLPGLRLEDNLSDGGEEGPGAETSRGEETRRGNQLLKEDKPAAQVSVGGNYFPEKIEIIPPSLVWAGCPLELLSHIEFSSVLGF